jgi:hypothetical protein
MQRSKHYVLLPFFSSGYADGGELMSSRTMSRMGICLKLPSKSNYLTRINAMEVPE